MPALRHMRRLGNLAGPPGCRPGPLAGMQVRVLPGAPGGTSRWPATAAVSKTEGPHGRASSILAPSAVGRRRRGGPAPGCYPGRGPGHEVRLLHLPPGSVGPAGVDARLSSGRSRVRVPYGARNAVVAAGCQFGPSIRTARVRFPSTVLSGIRPYEVVAACRILSPFARVQVPVGIRTMLSWRKWQTPRIQVPVSLDVWVRLPPRARMHTHLPEQVDGPR